MNFLRVGPGADWNSYATALVDRADEMLRSEERRNPAAGDVDATWTLPRDGDWGASLVLDLTATASGAERLAPMDIQALADPAAASSQLHRIWEELLDEDRDIILSASEPQLGRWDDGGA